MVNVMAPVMALELSRVIALSLTSVVKPAVPPTVMTPESVMVLPHVTKRLRPTLTVPRLRAVVPLSIVTSPVPVVVKLTAPVMALVVVSRVIAILATSAV